MTESAIILKSIHDELASSASEFTHGMQLLDDSLLLLNDQVSLTVSLPDDQLSPTNNASVHAHVLAEIRGSESLLLDACLLGCESTRSESLQEIGQLWYVAVGSMILSMFHNRSVAGACHFHGDEPWSIPGFHGFIGQSYTRLIPDDVELDALIDQRPFELVPILAPAGPIHLAKIVLQYQGDGRWKRFTEINGHQVRFTDHIEVPDLEVPPHSLHVSFAIFHHGENARPQTELTAIDKQIRSYLSEFETSKGNLDVVKDRLLQQNMSLVDVHRLQIFLTIAAARLAFEGMVEEFPDTYIQVHQGGTITADQRLIDEPLFARGWLILLELIQTGKKQLVTDLSLMSGDLQAIDKALKHGSKPENLILSPNILADPDVSDEDFQRALTQFSAPTKAKPLERPWWKLWSSQPRN